jgi:deoxyribodipyrimidine photo-lyase
LDTNLTDAAVIEPRSAVPALRIRAINDAAARGDGDYVLYWMIAARRTRWSFALQRAVDWCVELRRPLVVLEAIRCDYSWASDRLHAFAIDGMADNAAAFARAGVRHHPYVEAARGAGKGLLEALAARACVVVTDEFPEFFLPRMVAAAGPRLPARLEVVDGNGLLHLRATAKAHATAFHFRRLLQAELPEHLFHLPESDPLARLAGLGTAHLPAEVTRRWPAATAALLRREPGTLAALPIDHAVPPVDFRGGPVHAGAVLRSFVADRLPRYADERNQPQVEAASGLSPYLHWGFVSAHEVFDSLARAQGWTPERLALKPTGAREGWWGMDRNAEAFLDELVTWRELAYNTAAHLPEHDRYTSLPAWARATLEKHARDDRDLLPLDALEEGRSYDELWNATQGQLRREGRIHNYLRMIWGKRFLEWTRGPEEAVEWMLHLNNRWALDGRNPNSVSGIFWCLGRYDRPWAPERPIFGVVRYMSSANTARKLRVKDYIRRYSPAGSQDSQPTLF